MTSEGTPSQAKQVQAKRSRSPTCHCSPIECFRQNGCPTGHDSSRRREPVLTTSACKASLRARMQSERAASEASFCGVAQRTCQHLADTLLEAES